jgi:hypothetical protein
MLPIEIVHEISSLLREGLLSQRQIAARLGVSRATVGVIASGERGLHGRGEPETMPRARIGRRRPLRCRGCGYRVYMPCRICIAREIRRQKSSGAGTVEKQIKRRKRSSRARSQGD